MRRPNRTSPAGSPIDAPLFGREQALLALDAISGEHPVVLMTGSPGVGKSAVARAWAHSRREAWQGDAVIVDVREDRAQRGLVDRVAAALGVTLPTDLGEATDAVGRALAASDAPLLIDHYEVVADQADATVEAWVAAGAESLLLVSRVDTGLPFAVRLELDPLPVEVDGPAYQLFVERARRHRSDYDPEGEREAIGRLVDLLDGLPLAIELAASRMDVLAVTQIEALVERQRLELLSEDGAQRGLRDALTWSWESLDEADQAALRHASVFRGEFSLGAAAFVLGLGELETTRVLSRLRRHSLLVVSEPPPPAKELRYSLHRCIRDYAQQARDAPLDAARSRHAEYFGKRALQHVRAMKGAGAHDARARLRLAQSDLDEVTRRFLAGEDVEWVDASHAAMGAAMTTFAQNSGSIALERLAACVADARTPSASPVVAEAQLILAPGRVGADPEGLAEDMRAIAQLHRGVPELEGHALRWLSEALAATGDVERALEHAQAACDALRAARGSSLGYAIMTWGRASKHVGRRADARDAFGRALLLARANEDEALRGGAALEVANLALDDGDIPLAKSAYIESREVFERFDLRVFTGFIDGSLAAINHVSGELDAAVPMYTRAIERLRKVGRIRIAAQVGVFAALADAERGQLASAQRRLDRAAHEAGDLHAIRAIAIACRAVVLARRGNDAGAAADLETVRSLESEDRAVLATFEVASAIVQATQSGDSGNERPVPGSFEARILCRQFDATDEAVPVDAEGVQVLFSREHRWVDIPGAARLVLDRHPMLFGLFHTLVTAHHERAEQWLDVETILREVWPDERVRVETARARVYVAVARLRKLGLGDLVDRDRGRYRLDPDTEFRCADAD